MDKVKQTPHVRMSKTELAVLEEVATWLGETRPDRVAKAAHYLVADWTICRLPVMRNLREMLNKVRKEEVNSE